MKKFFNVFFVVLGVIFLGLIIVGGCLFLFKPDMKPAFMGGDSAGTTDKNPALSPGQEKALETFGIDPASVPSTFTPEQEACAVQALGQARVNEIKAGATPTATDYYKAKACM
jgi:hypothetical protein